MKRIVVIAMVAMFALAGAAYGGSKITGAQIKDGTVTSADIKNRTLTASDLSNPLLSSLRGKQGPQGPAGPAGPVNAAALTPVDSGAVYFGSDEIVKAAVASCPAGQRVISGGGVSISDQELAASQMLPSRTGWLVIGVDEYANGGEYVQATALCAPANTATLATANRDGNEISRLVASVRANHPNAKHH
jgi:hypothetical protein